MGVNAGSATGHRGAPLSALVVTYNDARYLDDCLNSLRGCAEILVVDLGSSDDSVEIADRHGARIVRHPWAPFGEKVRRAGAELATHPWILLADPDMVFPAGSVEKAWSLVSRHQAEGLGMIYFPLSTYFAGRRLRRGSRARLRAFRALFHRDRVDIPDLLHNRGFELRPGYWALGLVTLPGEAIRHYWVEDMKALMAKARRYLLYEAESRRAMGQGFSWRNLLLEEWRSLRADLHYLAFLDPDALRLMFFQLWYTWRANMELRKQELAKGGNEAAGRRG